MKHTQFSENILWFYMFMYTLSFILSGTHAQLLVTIVWLKKWYNKHDEKQATFVTMVPLFKGHFREAALLDSTKTLGTKYREGMWCSLSPKDTSLITVLFGWRVVPH